MGGSNYIISLTPTFTQGLILGQLSILILLALIFKYLFLDASDAEHAPGLSSHHRPQLKAERPPWNYKTEPIHENGQSPLEVPESAEWFNMLAQQVTEVYRSKLRDNLADVEGDEVARKRIESYVNQIRPKGFLDYINIHSVDLGVSAPRLSGARLDTGDTMPINPKVILDMTYVDSLSVSLSTAYLFNYPMSSFARLPISLTISLSLFKSSITLTPPTPSSEPPSVTISIPPDFTLDLKTTSLIGSRAKLADVAKFHELIRHHLHRILASRGTWKVALPGLGNMAEPPEHK
ncbi:hypothetical protein SERLA73DRAFT_186371 [Serpula lacrymans var. lacrymans S7.3]|uniref:SMP-LTD domain-containing protein n=2 Tax=Serpula lacrymans var. lacrymans TaxID=341189 RepID=F8Q764_SERL3|nr:uncharacterized protein SERLADRAFT_475377 [Serpula lacrymans var. lacrymans S7.9]EGN95402.1 hypothetical protein SERLA73DRAFT_186371 [Serpula lacrymans var. lacrymans S7.3]EGO20938.1 hypothetical protein SERLADRAFT_475377 [Serpula lacrymans var. lacrymans S7.9]